LGDPVTHRYGRATPLLAIVALAAGIGLSAWSYLRGFQRDLQGRVERELSSIADVKVGDLVAWREAQKREWAGFSTNAFLNAALRRAVGAAGGVDDGQRRQLVAALQSKRARLDAKAVLVLDRRGAVVLAVPDDAGPSAGELRDAQRALGEGGPLLDEGAPGDDLVVALAIEPGAPDSGVLLARYDTVRTLSDLVLRWPHPASTAEPVLVRRDGDHVVAVTKPLHTGARRLPLSLDIPTTRALKGVLGIVECNDYRGVPVIAALRHVPGTSWYLSVKVDRAEVFGPGRRHALIFAAVTLMLLAMAGGAVWFWWRAQLAAAAEARYQVTLLENLNDAVIGLDREARITAWAGAARRIYGFAAEEALGKHIGALLGGERSEATDARIRAELARTGRCQMELRHARKDGQPVDIEITSVALRDEQGEDAGCVVVHRDIGDRKRAEAEQRRLQSELVFADRLASIGTLAAGVAHEINNPLAFLVANLEYLKQGSVACGDDPDRKEALREASDGAHRIAEIVRSLKAFGRRDGAASAGAVDVRKAVSAAANMLQAQARPRARLVLELAETPHVFGKEHEVAQVVLNLAMNAIQAIPEGRPAENEVRVSTHVGRDGRVELAVRDTGVGIPPEVLGRIYDPFFTTKEVGEGSGLGLAICLGLVRGMGGTIDVDTAVGRGTTFTVRLPAAPAAQAELALPRPPASRRARVLVVDDESMVCAAIRRTLESEHEVVTTSDPRSALQRLSGGECYDVVLCDLLMPHLTGMECFDALSRERPEMARRMVFLTGGAFTPGARKFIDDHRAQCIEKPFEPEELRARVAEAVDRLARA
jgi:PAS domain S-box-containing protein